MSNEEQIKQEKRKQEKRKQISEKSLLLILFLFQFASLFTTIEGSRVILSSLDPLVLGSKLKIPAYLILGIGIQLFILWLFTLGKHALKSRFTLWVLILVYTSLSIYTSFFAFYEGFSQKELSERTPALDQSEQIIKFIQESQVYKKESEEYETLSNDLEDAKQRSKDYCDSCRNEKKQILEDEVRKLQKQINDDYGRTKKFEEYRENKGDEFNGMTASKIYEFNGEIVSDFYDVIPKDFIKKQQGESQNFFLFPFIKLLELDPNAVAALLIASIVDGTAIFLGINKERKQGEISLLIRKLAEGAKNFLPHLIEDITHTLFTIIRSLGGILHGIIYGVLAALQRTFQIFVPRNNHIIMIEGRRHDFLNFLWDSIEHSWVYSGNGSNYAHRIDYKTLILFSQNNKSFQRGYKKIIARMYELNWLERQVNQDDTIKIGIKEYKKFEKWYLKEHNKRFDQERHNMSAAKSFYTVINLPKENFFLKYFER